jgi:hypothetical protein
VTDIAVGMTSAMTDESLVAFALRDRAAFGAL